MMATGFVLREVPLRCGDEPPAVRGRAPCWSDMHSRSYGLSEAQVQALETEPAPG